MTVVEAGNVYGEFSETLASIAAEAGEKLARGLSTDDFLLIPVHDLAENIRPAVMEVHHDFSQRGLAIHARRMALLLNHSDVLPNLDLD